MKKLLIPLIAIFLIFSLFSNSEATKAKRIEIDDAGEYYLGTNVQDVLQEIATSSISINWPSINESILTGVNWPAYSGSSSTNWDGALEGVNWSLLDEDDLTGINWPAYEAGSVFPYSKIEFVVDGGGTTIDSGSSGHKVIPFNCTITAWEIVSTASGSAVVDIKKSTYATFDTFNSIAGSEKPTLSSAIKNTDTSLSTWTTSISAGDRIQAYVDSADITGVVVVTLYVTKI